MARSAVREVDPASRANAQLEVAEAKLRGHAALNARLVSQVVAATEREKKVQNEYRVLASSLRREEEGARATARVNVDEMIRLHKEELRAEAAEAKAASCEMQAMRDAHSAELRSLRNDLNL